MLNTHYEAEQNTFVIAVEETPKLHKRECSGPGLHHHRLYVAGGFETAGGKPIAKLALWQIPQAIKAEYTETSLSLSWPELDVDFALESSDSIPSQNWQPVPGAPTLIRNRWTLTFPRPATTQFYRLRQK